jgi:hypothetical protein
MNAPKGIVGPPRKASTPPRHSPFWSEDGNWRWENDRWVSNISENGLWRWDGQQWVASEAGQQPVMTEAGQQPVPTEAGQQPVPTEAGQQEKARANSLGFFQQLLLAIGILVLVGGGGLVAYGVIQQGGFGNSWYLHYSCGRSTQCALADGGASGVRGGTFSSNSACNTAGAQMGMVQQGVGGGAGWFCSTSSDPGQMAP